MHLGVFTPRYGQGYGAGYSAKKEVEAMARLGHQVFVVHDERRVSDSQHGGITFTRCPLSRWPILNIALISRQVRRTVQRLQLMNRIDLWCIQSLEFGFIPRRNFQVVPVVYFARSTILGVELHKSQEYWLDAIRRACIVPILLWLERRCLRNSVRVIVKSKKNETRVD